MKKKDSQKGFLLIELIVASAIFVVVMTISMGAILNIFDNNRRAKAMKDVASNVTFVVESMSKEMRFGTKYHCNSIDFPLSDPKDCDNGEKWITFLTQNNKYVTYCLSEENVGGDSRGTIRKWVSDWDPGWFAPSCDTNPNLFTAVTASSIDVDDLKFYVFGSDTLDAKQPRVLIVVKAHAGSETTRTDFTLETLVTQRELDV